MKGLILMGLFKRAKESLNSTLAGDKLGEVQVDDPYSEGESEEELDPTQYITPSKKSTIYDKKRIISELSLMPSIPTNLVSVDEIQAVEFTMTVPSGLDVREVKDFCDFIEEGVADYHKVVTTLARERELLIRKIVTLSEDTTIEKSLGDLQYTDFSESDYEVERLKGALEEARSKIASLERDLSKPSPLPLMDPSSKETDAQLSSLNSELEEVKSQLELSQEALESREREVETLTIENESTREELKELRRQVNEKSESTKIQELQEEKRQLVAQLNRANFSLLAGSEDLSGVPLPVFEVDSTEDELLVGLETPKGKDSAPSASQGANLDMIKAIAKEYDLNF